MPKRTSLAPRTRAAKRVRNARRQETADQMANRLAGNRARAQQNAQATPTRQGCDKEALLYDCTRDYEGDPNFSIGSMSATCDWCGAKKWNKESASFCCNKGKVNLGPVAQPPELLRELYAGETAKSKQFLSNIRAYNSCFQMTSFGAKVIREPGYMPTFKIQGQVYHLAGSLYPRHQESPNFLQIYFVSNMREQAQRRTSLFDGVKEDLVLELQSMLHNHNNYVNSFKFAKDKLAPEFKLVIRADRAPSGEHERCFNKPTTDEVAVLIAGDQTGSRDIILEQHDASLKRISETHRSYDSLQYPLLYPYGEDGYHFCMWQYDPKASSHVPGKKISAMQLYSYKLMTRTDEFNLLLRGRELSHQFFVDMYAKIESERLQYLRHNQKQLRAEQYVHLRDAIQNDGSTQQLGQLVILPSSFTGGPRYMHERTQDAMCYVREYGRPDLFITFTCNPKWEEIENNLLPSQKPQDRHDLIARVFHLKLLKSMELLNKRHVFGKVRCHIFTVEWQKRGLPHAHILVWLIDKIHPDHIDSVICAEIPDPNQDPILHDIIKKNMIHGPCGAFNNHSPCMKDGQCLKRYPKQLLTSTQTGNDGYPMYRRRCTTDGGFTAVLTIRNHGVVVDNKWVVPYNPYLCRIFNAHINVEYCNSIKSIKYVCKYINKGSDMAVFAMEGVARDEIKNYQLGRYVSTNEAVWRILGFPIHDRHPSVMHLDVHLENGQRVYFTEDNVHERASSPPETTLTAFFKLCQQDEFASTLLYNEVPRYYTWNSQRKKWQRRVQGAPVGGYVGIKSSDCIGRVYTIHPNNAECYYLRLLLHHIRGPTGFDHFLSVDGQLCTTFRQACNLRGLLHDDTHWDQTLQEAALCSSPCKIRELFSLLLHLCGLSDPLQLWMSHRESMSEDFLHQQRSLRHDLNLDFNEAIFNQALIDVEDKLLSLPGSQDLHTYGLPETNRSTELSMARELLQELSYDQEDMAMIVTERESNLTDDQQAAYDQILQIIDSNNGKLMFLDAPGGTGKTYLINLLLAKLRSSNNIALAVASSGIAATLLKGGRTAHSAFKLPLNLAKTENPTCNIKRGSAIAELLRKCKLIVWDECTMSHKQAFEALDRTLRDLRSNNFLMGGVPVLLSGDFRQTLPIISRGTRADEFNASLKTSVLWSQVLQLSLSTNMRVHLLEIQLQVLLPIFSCRLVMVQFQQGKMV